MRRKFWEHERGMTLIEVLIAMVIIGILSAIAIPYYGRVMEQAKDKKMLTDLRNLAVGIGVYKVDFDRVPDAANATELVAILRETQGKTSPLMDKDPWGHYFDYLRDSDPAAQSYTLRCRGKDGIIGVWAMENDFNVDNDTIVINGLFVASHQGVASVAH